MKELESVILELQVSEKGTMLQESGNKYLLRVAPRATKADIRRAVEALFKVEVAKVNTMRYEGKRKRERTVRYGKRADWKRAVVTLKGDGKIEVT